jgi:hypothetical protein
MRDVHSPGMRGLVGRAHAHGHAMRPRLKRECACGSDAQGAYTGARAAQILASEATWPAYQQPRAPGQGRVCASPARVGGRSHPG